MKGDILVTDTLFIFDEHVKQLKDAGYNVVREKGDLTEDELCHVVKGKVGYILGGIEHATDKVIDAADQLKAISVIATGYEWFVPGWKHALEKGILITNIPDGPTNEVAEWAVMAALAMNRELLDLGRVGKKMFTVTKGLESQKVGIIGLGHIGSRIAEIVKVFRPDSISYYSGHRDEKKEKSLGTKFLDLPELLAQSDVVFLCVSDGAKNFMTSKEFKQMKDDALFVNITHPGIVDETALLEVLKDNRVRAISDFPMSPEGFNNLPLSHWYCNNTSNTITQAGSKYMSDEATQSMLNLLSKGTDKNIVS